MKGKTPQPVQLQIYSGNKNHKTKAQIKDMQESQVKLGGKKFTPSETIKNDEIALEKWNNLINTYLEYDIDFISDSDSGIIEQYCMAYATLVRLEKEKANLIRLSNGMNISTVTEDVQKAINTQVKLMIPLSDRLFLNPVAKIKGLRKKQEPKKDNKNKFEQQFGEI